MVGQGLQLSERIVGPCLSLLEELYRGPDPACPGRQGASLSRGGKTPKIPRVIECHRESETSQSPRRLPPLWQRPAHPQGAAQGILGILFCAESRECLSQEVPAATLRPPVGRQECGCKIHQLPFQRILAAWQAVKRKLCIRPFFYILQPRAALPPASWSFEGVCESDSSPGKVPGECPHTLVRAERALR